MTTDCFRASPIANSIGTFCGRLPSLQRVIIRFITYTTSTGRGATKESQMHGNRARRFPLARTPTMWHSTRTTH